VKQSLSYYRVGNVPKQFDLAAVAEESLQVFTGKFQRAGVDVVKKITPGSTMLGFPVEASLAGGHLTLSVRPSRHWRNQQAGIRFTIADTGSGIPKENFSRIFEPFFTTKPEKGNGLGLWVVRGIVAKHDGSIRIRSSEGKKSGTIISVFFPWSRNEAQQAFSQSGFTG
jgi:signal transduction histidine kinase